MILGGGVAVCLRLFTLVGTSRDHLCDSTAFLLIYGSSSGSGKKQ